MAKGVRRLAERYGKVFGYWLGRQRWVMISDYEMLKETFGMDATTNRPATADFHGQRYTAGTENQGKSPGIFYTLGKFWREQRAFMQRHMGFGTKAMEKVVVRQSDKLCEHLGRSREGSTCIKDAIDVTVVNILWITVFGQMLGLDDPKAVELMHAFNHLVHVTPTLSAVSNLLPYKKMTLWPIIRNVTGVDNIMRTRLACHSIIARQISEHEENMDPDNPKDYVALSLNKIASTTDPESSFFGCRGLCFLESVLAETFVAGMASTANSVLFTILYLLHHPEAKKRMQDEIDHVTGWKEHVEWEDSEDMHFTKAVIHESYRLTRLFPFGAPHMTLTEVEIGPYRIPKGTVIQGDIAGIMCDPHYFADPETFNPERFITPEGKFHSDERVIPFSVGKRRCPASTIADKEHFLLVTGILKNFDVEPDPSAGLPSYDLDQCENFNFMRPLPEFKVVLTKRGNQCEDRQQA